MATIINYFFFNLSRTQVLYIYIIYFNPQNNPKRWQLLSFFLPLVALCSTQDPSSLTKDGTHIPTPHWSPTGPPGNYFLHSRNLWSWRDQKLKHLGVQKLQHHFFMVISSLVIMLIRKDFGVKTYARSNIGITAY